MEKTWFLNAVLKQHIILRVGLAFSLFLLAIAKSTGQQLIVNVVTDNTSKTPMSIKVFFNGKRQIKKADSYNIYDAAYTEGQSNYGRLQIQALGCRSVDTLVPFAKEAEQSLVLNIRLYVLENQSELVTIHGNKIGSSVSKPFVSQSVETLNEKDLHATSGSNLADALTSIQGLTIIKTGNGIGKPILRGLSGNRLLILNNGIRQEGQQWGSEHAPEIDPFTATNIEVVKGASALKYGPDAIAGVISLKPRNILEDTGFHSILNAIATSNGFGRTANLQLFYTKHKKGTSFGISAGSTYRNIGNTKTANYYLENTGIAEKNANLNLVLRHNKLSTDIYASYFSTFLGIFTASHVSNLEDLYAAFNRAKPITKDTFSYIISRPFQQVNHTLVKASFGYRLKDDKQVNATVAYQDNNRQEFSFIPYNGSARPSLYFDITTLTTDLTYSFKPLAKKFSYMLGAQTISQSNIWEGRFFIPNFRSNALGVFYATKYSFRNKIIEGGIRQDYKQLSVFKRLNSYAANSKVIETAYDWVNTSLYIGILSNVSQATSISANFGTGWRAPAVNELYSNGIHQSAASYESGDSTLTPERSYNFNTELHIEFPSGLHLDISPYVNYINGFIYARPDLQPKITIQGVFPAFSYIQTNALLIGSETKISYQFKRITTILSGSYLYAQNLTASSPLIYMPPLNALGIIDYKLYQSRSNTRLKTVKLNFTERYVAKQTRAPSNQDYVPPPPGYWLTSFGVISEIPIKNKTILTLSANCSNAFNISYRDYLNRFRYFSDDTGINFTLRASIKV